MIAAAFLVAAVVIDAGAVSLPKTGTYDLPAGTVRVSVANAARRSLYISNHSHPSPAVCGSSDWAHQEYVFTVPADASPDATYWVRPRIINASGEACYDDFLLEEVK